MTNEANTNQSSITLYQSDDGKSRIAVVLDAETVWLSQAKMAELYQTTTQNIGMHVKAIYAENELLPDRTCKDYLQVRSEGTRLIERKVKHYNLDVILAVGYRVRSTIGVKFRQWATERLKEYVVKGFTLDDERLKGSNRQADYFDELLERIRDIRASEARVYQRIRDIFAMAVDYKEDSEFTDKFFKSMQNKIHFAATGMTAPEIVKSRANAELSNMGLTSWKGNRVIKRDVVTVKNYLDEKEIDTLNRITVMFLDQAEFRALRRQNIHLGDWEAILDKFLTDTELPVLTSSGIVKRSTADDWANKEYEKFADRRRKEEEIASEARYLKDLQESTKDLATSPKGKNKLSNR